MRHHMAIVHHDSPFLDLDEMIDGLDADTAALVDEYLLDVPEITSKTVSKDDEIYRFSDM